MVATIVDDKPIVKPTYWENEELKPRRLAGRPHKKNLLQAPRSQLVIYNRLAKQAYVYIKELEGLARSKNERIKLEALKVLIDKILPNAKVAELASKHAPISVFINNQGFVPPDGDAYATSGGSLERPTQIQGVSVASEGEENIDSDKRDSETSDAEKGSVLAPVSDVRGS